MRKSVPASARNSTCVNVHVVDHDVDTDVDLGSTLQWYTQGRSDLTTSLERSSSGRVRFVRGTWTPHGAGTLLITSPGGSRVDAEAWGPGAAWLLERVPWMIGKFDDGAGYLADDEHPVVAACCRANRRTRFGSSGMLFHELLPTILQQRITGLEGKRQWMSLCRSLGESAPGPFPGVRLPPAPGVLQRQPSWWFHPLGIETKGARALIEVARHAEKMWEWSTLPASDAAHKLQLIPGIGVWTTGVVLGPALGDTDAVPVGDYHVKNVIAWNLANEPRATDERMLELLAPYEGQRGRVLQAVMSHGRNAPKYGARQRILPMAKW